MFEREFYPLSEVADRLGCAISDLLHLGIQCRAQICVNIYGMADGLRKIRMQIDPEEERPFHVMPVGIFMLSSEDIRCIEVPDGLPFELFEAAQFDESASGNKSWWAVEFDPPIKVNFGHLVVLMPEVDRLEALHASQKNDNADSQDKPEVLKRNNFIDKYKNIWPSIDNDLRDASREGFESLAAAMVENRKGYWIVYVALAWAKDNFKIKNPPANTMANVPSRKITTQ
jgi:hypothetical protein